MLPHKKWLRGVDLNYRTTGYPGRGEEGSYAVTPSGNDPYQLPVGSSTIPPQCVARGPHEPAELPDCSTPHLPVNLEPRGGFEPPCYKAGAPKGFAIFACSL